MIIVRISQPQLTAELHLCQILECLYQKLPRDDAVIAKLLSFAKTDWRAVGGMVTRSPALSFVVRQRYSKRNSVGAS